MRQSQTALLPLAATAHSITREVLSWGLLCYSAAIVVFD